jgi:hypothetical protein
MDKTREEYSLKLFKKSNQKLFNENIEGAYIDYSRIVAMYPDTLIAMKCHFMLNMINLMELYAQCILTESYSNGIKSLKQNVVLDLFNKNRYHFVRMYEIHAKKREQAFEKLCKTLNNLIEADQDYYPEIFSYINFSAESLKKCNTLARIDEIRDGTIFSDEELKKMIRDLEIYLLITIVSDNFDVEYVDELSSIDKRRLNRADFYNSCISWLNKFYHVRPDTATGELIKTCCTIVLGLTTESSDLRRQQAFETISQMSKNYYSMPVKKETIIEQRLPDIEEELYTLDVSISKKKDLSLIELASLDGTVGSCLQSYNLHDTVQLAFEINLEPSEEIIEARQQLGNTLEEKSKPEDFGLHLEFD